MFIPLLKDCTDADFVGIRMNRIMANPDLDSRDRSGVQLIAALGVDCLNPILFHVADVIHMEKHSDRINAGEYLLEQLGYPEDYCPEVIQP